MSENRGLKYVLGRIGYAFDWTIFESRWLLSPLYLVLIFALVLYEAKCFSLLGEMVHSLRKSETVLLISVVNLVDMTMIANLVLVIVQGGKHLFIQVLQRNVKDRPEWFHGINASTLKIKMGKSLMGCSMVSLLTDFLAISEVEWYHLSMKLSIHLAFVACTMSYAWIDKVHQHAGPADDQCVEEDWRQKTIPGQLAYWFDWVVFESRWLLAPLYLLLIVAFIIYGLKCFCVAGEMIAEYRSSATILLVFVLNLVDMVMIANLVMVIVQGGKHLFIQGLQQNIQDRPRWFHGINSATLKIKMGMSVMGVACVGLMRIFYDIDQSDWTHLSMQLSILGTFMVSTMAVAWIDTLHPRA